MTDEEYSRLQQKLRDKYREAKETRDPEKIKKARQDCIDAHNMSFARELREKLKAAMEAYEKTKSSTTT